MNLGIIFFIILISTCGCITSENGNEPKDSITYMHDSVSLNTITGHTNESYYNITIINITQTNITKINFTLEWIDYSFDPNIMGLDEIDIFDMEIFGPDNELFQIRKSSVHNRANRTGHVYLEARLDEVQYIEELDNKPENIINETIRTGSEIWYINISCLNSTGFEASCYCPKAVRTEDNGNSWKLDAMVHYYFKEE